VKSADGNNAGLLMELDAILRRDPCGTLLTGAAFSLASSVLGAPDHSDTPSYTILLDRRARRKVNLVVKRPSCLS